MPCSLPAEDDQVSASLDNFFRWECDVILCISLRAWGVKVQAQISPISIIYILFSVSICFSEKLTSTITHLHPYHLLAGPRSREISLDRSNFLNPMGTGTLPHQNDLDSSRTYSLGSVSR